MKFVSKNLTETEKIAFDFIASLKPTKRACVVGLFGELGAGKTTFTKSAAEALGVVETVNSPTFVIERIFEANNPFFKKFIHIDAYRLVHGQDLVNLGWNEIIQDPENLIFIEWPEKVLDILPEDRIEVQFEHLDEKSRQITIQN